MNTSAHVGAREVAAVPDQTIGLQESRELASALIDLGRSLDALRNELRDAPRPQREVPTPAGDLELQAGSQGGALSDDVDLANSIHELTTTMRMLLSKSPGGQRLGTNLPVPVFLDKSATFDTSDLRNTMAKDDDPGYEAAEAGSRRMKSKT
ncbi:MAG: hypothetical protein ACI841_003868 [Planctomycetota bacterium]|jgi:hypothetical protein